MAAQREAGLMSSGAANAGWKETRVENAPITLAEAGIDKNLADRARKFAGFNRPKFGPVTSMGVSVVMSGGRFVGPSALRPTIL